MDQEAEVDDEPQEALSGVVLGAMLGAAMWLMVLALVYTCSQPVERQSGGAPMRAAPFDAGGLT